MQLNNCPSRGACEGKERPWRGREGALSKKKLKIFHFCIDSRGEK